MTGDDIVILLADGAAGRNYRLDPIRLMKGAFLVSQRGRDPWRELFHFRPYDYGPFDRAVYGLKDSLVRQGLLEARPDGRYDSYVLTSSGQARVGEIEAAEGVEDAAWVRQVGAFVCSRSFSRLLRDVYAEYPAFAVRSVMSPAQ
jgi:uncharacterized protein